MTFHRAPFRRALAVSRTFCGSSCNSKEVKFCILDKLRGAAGGALVAARQCSRIRGTTQPIKEMNSSRYTDANHGEA